MYSIRGPVSLIVCCLLFLFLPAAGSGPDMSPVPDRAPSKVFVEGEELTYNVRYGFIDLGQVRIVSTRRIRNGTSTEYEGDAIIQSYRGVPFVDLHAVYHTRFDSTGFSRYFLGKSREDKSWSFAEYHFQYPENRVILKVGAAENVPDRIDTVSLESRYHDGLSLFFFARENLFAGTPMHVPTFVKEEKGVTFIDFKGKRSVVESDFIDYPVDVVGFDGRAGFVGLFGLTGDFEGWFSNDEARVPIKANMKVIIGSVTLELVGWKRAGWNPPRAPED